MSNGNYLFIYLLYFKHYDCRLEDLAGYGVANAVAKEFASAYPNRTFKSPVVDLLIKNGRNGKLITAFFRFYYI